MDNLTDKQKLDIAIQNTKNLEKRVIDLEEQVALLLRSVRVLAEEKAKDNDPNYKVHEKIEA